MHRIQPGAAWLTVNRRCNFRCKWCYAEATGYKTASDMPFELAKTLTHVVQQIGIHNLLVIGGEPTLWRPLVEFNEYCNRKGLRTVLVTNGAQFGNDHFWRRYTEHPNNKIGLSLKASTSQQLREVAGADNFEVVKKGIIRAVREMDAQVSITYNIFYTETLIDMVRFAVECGARSVKIDFCSTTFIAGQPNSAFMVAPRKLADNIMKDYPELERITGGRIVFEMMVPFCIWPPDFVRELKRKERLLSVCHVHKRKGVIFDEVGNVIVCNALFDYPIGRYGEEFRDGESLLAWLNSPRIMGYYNRIGCYPSAACKECQCYSECGGGCPLRWALYRPNDLIRPMIENPVV